ncbi:PqiC family protein [Solimonas terrae]|uniref:Membrane integrity-associated transporter subunit PqiC n=1 Tax=Solimonas terrae TaxID=1396819 RepID=A0A6M2BQF9_9GAMM|nr:PqiC family protein [Solimonas terrae]NGY04688.1 membrane integrity-associated transporter subunit PqiC [Solimonas terrae]
MSPHPKRGRRLWPAVTALLMVAACSDDHTHFYTLLKPDTAAPAVAGEAAFVIDVQPVHVPAQVDQPELVVRQGSGELALVETRQWIAPLKDEVRGALSAALSQRLHTQDVAGVAAPAGLPVYQVMLDVQRFDGWLGHSVDIGAVWTVRASGGGIAPGAANSWTCASRTNTKVGGGYEPLVIGAQQAMAQIADRIATLIVATRQNADPAGIRCPSAS